MYDNGAYIFFVDTLALFGTLESHIFYSEIASYAVEEFSHYVFSIVVLWFIFKASSHLHSVYDINLQIHSNKKVPSSPK